MPALKSTAYEGSITWLGRVEGSGLCAQSVDALEIGWDGPVGEAHAGRTRSSCSRVLSQHPKGTEIANTRALSVLSVEELAEIAASCALETLDPALLGATLVISGIPDFTHIPPSARLQGPDGVTLVVDMENRPCQLPAREIEAAHPGHGKPFKPAARGKRGVTAWVERPGVLRLGDTLRLHIPDQRAWAHLEAARGES